MPLAGEAGHSQQSTWAAWQIVLCGMALCVCCCFPLALVRCLLGSLVEWAVLKGQRAEGGNGPGPLSDSASPGPPLGPFCATSNTLTCDKQHAHPPSPQRITHDSCIRYPLTAGTALETRRSCLTPQRRSAMCLSLGPMAVRRRNSTLVSLQHSLHMKAVRRTRAPPLA